MFAQRVTRSLVNASRMQVRGYADAAPASSSLKLTFASANESFFKDQEVEQVNVPSTAGDFGILANHVPSLAIMRPGVVSVHQGGKASDYFVSSGSIVVNADSTVQIIAEEACPVDHLDASKAQSGLSEAQNQLQSASSDLAKAEAEIGIEVNQAILGALNAK
eukprot:Nk52_evm54s1737 gene=Nk52_evmTU54s1737